MCVMKDLLFKTITIQDKPLFDQFLKRFPPEISELTFTNLFCWRMPKKHEFTLVDNHLLVSFINDNHRKFYQPIGPNPETVVEKILDMCPDSTFERVEKKIVQQLPNSFIVSTDRDMYDYVYNKADLIRLSGKKLSSKRNFVKRCSSYHPKICQLDRQTVQSFLQLEEKWCNLRHCYTDEKMIAEDRAVKEAIENFEELNLFGICIFIDKTIAAFSIGEPLNENTFVEHFEKANTDFIGIYPYLLTEFSKHVPQQFTLINREQDLGMEGLRKAKLSYQPALLIEKYQISNSAI